ncbi:MAG: hypothetical protein U5K77_03215 [Candidatus Saccharibacteria bacterium]|nr:hypothetical protein [Candidatus Saccharibacteria bacterium]
MASVERQGIGAILTINGNTRAMKGFLDDIPRQFGDVVAYNQVHVTMLDYQETAIDVVTERDLIALDNANKHTVDYLGSLPLSQMVLRPSREVRGLAEFGRFLGVTVEKTPEVEHIRSKLLDIVMDTMRVDVLSSDENDSDFVPHMSTVMRPKSKNKQVKPKSFMPSVSGNLHVDGFDTGRRLFQNDKGFKARSKQKYSNQPTRVRNRGGKGLRAVS